MFHGLLFEGTPSGDGWDGKLGFGSYTVITRLKPEGSILKVPVNPNGSLITLIFCTPEPDPTSERHMLGILTTPMSDICTVVYTRVIQVAIWPISLARVLII